MLIFVTVVAGAAALLGLSVVLKLRSIRTRGFGEGSHLDLPAAGIEMRYPHWWKPVRETGPEAASQAGPAPGGAGGSGEDRPDRCVVVLKTGHSRGLLRITTWRENGLQDGGEAGEASLRAGLAAHLRDHGVELDDPEMTAQAIGQASGNNGGLRVWVASGGRQTSHPEERTYFEVHLLAMGGARVLFSYTNSILQGFLDAYYLEKVLETLQPARFPR